MHARRRWIRVAVILLAGETLALSLALAVLLAATWLWWLDDPSDGQRSRGVNALWAGHTWVGDAHRDDEYRSFAELMVRHEISDVFFHAGPLEADGSVPAERTLYAEELLAVMQRHAPQLRVQAYLGQIEARGGGILDLGDASVRAGIVETAEHFLDLGFEGIHYDVEPIFPGDDAFLDLLDKTRERTMAHGAVLSVALEQLEFVPGAQKAINIVAGGFHDPTAGFLRTVAERVDQVAIMTYDSAMPLGPLFGAHMAWQTERVIDAIGDEVTVFMGVPTYDDGAKFRFYPWAENLPNAIRGVRKGLDAIDDDRSGNVGIAIFAEWTTSDEEWADYADAWLRR